MENGVEALKMAASMLIFVLAITIAISAFTSATQALKRIFDIKNGLRIYDNIKIIRIISKDYNLLIMKDYLPIIGEIEGSVDIKNDEVNLSFKDIKAFYMNSDNIFNLMIKEG